MGPMHMVLSVGMTAWLSGCSLFQDEDNASANEFDGTWLLSYDSDAVVKSGDCADDDDWYDYYDYYDDDYDEPVDVEADTLAAIISLDGKKALVSFVDWGLTMTGKIKGNTIEVDYTDGWETDRESDLYIYTFRALRKGAKLEGEFLQDNVETYRNEVIWSCTYQTMLTGKRYGD